MEGYPVTIAFDLHWGEMDAFGHVNNARYFTWFESARMGLFERLGLPLGGAPEVGPILAQTSCDFLLPVTYPARIVVGTRIARLGRTSFTMEYAAAREEAPDEPVARATGVVVMVDYQRGGSVPLTPELRAALEGLRGPVYDPDGR